MVRQYPSSWETVRGRACQGNSFRGRGKNTFVGSFIRPYRSKTISMSPVAMWRVAWWTSLGGGGWPAGAAGKRGSKGCSVSGISSWDRKRHFVPPKKSVQLPQMTIAGHHHRRRHRTKLPLSRHQPPVGPSYLPNGRALCNVRADETINEFIVLEWTKTSVLSGLNVVRDLWGKKRNYSVGTVFRSLGGPIYLPTFLSW